MKKNKMKMSIVEESDKGLYVWIMPDGSIVMDEEGAYLSIVSMKGDIRQIKKLKDVAKYHGLEDGEPLFFAGHRPVTDEELQIQRQRMEAGLVPDTQDLPAMMDYVKEVREMGIG